MRADYHELDISRKVLITGSAGFIGFHLSRRLLEQGMSVTGFDNLNDYYDVRLKHERLRLLEPFADFCFVKGDLADQSAVFALFEACKPDLVVHLAAQAGVRYSIDHPDAYIQSNVTGFMNILEACRRFVPEHLIYASSSSVYGANQKIPFSVTDTADKPVSLYAATKKSNELMAYAYSHLYGIPSTGLRFFTVYGPYGRPDMAYFSFAQKILDGAPITIYNHGDMYRDFTYIDDIVTGIENMLCNPPLPDQDGVMHKIYNIGNHRPEKLTDFIAVLEKCLGRTAEKIFAPMQPGDVYRTYADVEELVRDFDFKPDTPIEKGLEAFTRWFQDYRVGTAE